MHSIHFKRTVLISIIVTLVCISILSAGFRFSKKLCIKDRSYLCSVYSIGLSNEVKINFISNKASVVYFASDIVFPKDLEVSIFHPPSTV